MKQTTNYNLVKPELTDSPPDITVMNTNWDKIDAELKSHDDKINNLSAYAVASGTNTYIATIAGITSLTEGISVRIKFTNANTGTGTLNINSLGAKAIVKSNGAALSSGNIKAGQICNLAYTGSNFQLLGEGGEYGTATASDVLSGKTIGTEEGLVTGTMPNNGSLGTITPGTANQQIPAGYTSGGTVVGDADLIPANIKAGANIFGVVGNSNVVETSSGDATAAQILSGKKAYVKGALITGTIPSKSAQTYTPGTTNQTIAAGPYLSGVQTIEGSANLIPENIKDGVNIFGKIGNYNNSGMSKVTSDSFQCARLQSSSGGFGSVSGFSLAIANYATETVNNILFIIEGGSSIRFRLTSGTPVLIRRITNESTGGSFVGQITNLLESPESGIGSSSFLVYNPDKQPIDIYRYYSGGNMFVYKLIV